MLGRSKLFIILLFTFLVISGCSKNQDDIDLPIYDAIGGDFTLPSTLGAELNLSDYRGKVILLNFGYTSCPDICPMVLHRLAKLSVIVEEQYGVSTEHLQTIFITVDPERDSLGQLKEYLTFFNKSFIGISGSTEQTAELTKRYAVFFEKLAEEGMGYQVAHTDKIFLIDKRGRLRALYGKSDPDEQLINDIVSLVSADI